MEKKQLKRLPIGMQTFKKIIEGNYMYIDKTEYIWEMIHRSSFVFLSRPRRFGKSLLATTMDISKQQATEALKAQYDGYHFTWPSPDIFNPFSLLNSLTNKDLNNYWFDSGTPTFLIEMLRKFKVQPSQIGKCDALASAFDTPTENIKEILPLMYQSGYLTIKDYNRFTNLYSLDIPNKEVRIGLMQSLFPNYVQQTTEDHGCTVIAEMYDKLLKEDVNGVLTLLQQFLLTVPQCDNTHYEGHYQQMLYIIFSLFGMYVDVEVRTSTGRVDMVMRTATKLYLFELKTNRSAEAAIKQIDLKDYPSRFTLDHLPIVRVGINFDCDKHTITEWEIAE